MKLSAFWRWRTTILLLVMSGIGGWLYLSPDLQAANRWSWEEQLAMESAMDKAAQAAPETVPEIDRAIPATETALFALG